MGKNKMAIAILGNPNPARGVGFRHREHEI